jgi:hypothetical protein
MTVPAEKKSGRFLVAVETTFPKIFKALTNE